jgi:hypothetical protein
MHRRAALLSALFLFGCGLGFSHDEQIVGPYRLIAVDVSEQMHVAYSLGKDAIGRIPETVFAVGWNDHYIVAKQHPHNDRNVTNFYILDMSRDSATTDPAVSVTGPLAEDDFKRKQSELGLPVFKRTIKSLE